MPNPQRVHVIATQHLDVAWLWTRAPYGEELMRQCFERAIEMIEAGDAAPFFFSRSTVWSFWVIEQRYPELFEKIKTYVAQGRIELCGGEWVEPDHLIPSGESLVRQCALGQWYFLKTFGKAASVCWDPDIFGHPHSLPQILKKCGMDGFYSHRCRPRDDDGAPLHQFIWEGPDGSRIFYLSGTWIGAPESAAISAALADQSNQDLPAVHVVTGASSDRRITMQKDWVPLPEATAQELGLAECRWSTATKVLDDMRTYADRLPVVRGELGFQFTGTYTSNGFNKRTNRYVEGLLVSAETAAAWASTYGFRYPQQQLTQAWRDHCVNQFHDVICGCSVADVHREDRALWAAIIRRGDFARDEALAFLCDRIYSGMEADEKDGDVVGAFNLLTWSRAGEIALPLAEGEGVEVSTLDGMPLPVQVTEACGSRTALIRMPDVPGIGYQLLRVRRCEDTGDADVPAGTGDGMVLENELVRVEIDPATGELMRLFDKVVGTEGLRPGGRGNRLLFLEDAHGRMPAWSIEYTGREPDGGTVESVELVENGPIRRMVRVVRTVQLSPDLPATTIVQEIMLTVGSGVVTFALHGDWQAQNVMLKAVFDLPFDCDAMAADAPYGVIERTPEDAARVRQPDADGPRNGQAPKLATAQDWYMQRWLDVSDGARGMLFLNNGLYGYDIVERSVRLSLLRAPLDPAQQLATIGLGPFAFTYGVLAHADGWREVDAPRLGAGFDQPLLVRPIRDGFERGGVWRDWWDLREGAPDDVAVAFIETLESRGTVVTVVKAAEDGEGLVLRLAETRGEPDRVVLRAQGPVTSAIETDMLERPLADAASPATVSVSGREMAAEMAPWEVKTIRVVV